MANKKVKLKVIGEDRTQSFEIEVANKLLQLKKPAWELKDDRFIWNGRELANAPKKPQKEKSE